MNKYAMKDSYGHIYEHSPEDMHWRIANEVARIEAKYPNPLSAQQLFELFDHFRYIIPQGSPMTGIGNNFQIASLSNCFVVGIDGEADSYGAIFKIDEEQVQLMKRRGGRGSRLVPHPPQGFPGKELGPYLYRAGTLHGTILQLHTRGCPGRTTRRADAERVHQAPRLGSLHRCQDGRRQGDGSQRLGEAGRRVYECRHRTTPLYAAIPHKRSATQSDKGNRRVGLVEKNRAQRMEVGRTGSPLLGHHLARVCPRLLCRPGLPHHLYQPLRRNPPLSL